MAGRRWLRGRAPHRRLVLGHGMARTRGLTRGRRGDDPSRPVASASSPTDRTGLTRWDRTGPRWRRRRGRCVHRRRRQRRGVTRGRNVGGAGFRVGGKAMPTAGPRRGHRATGQTHRVTGRWPRRAPGSRTHGAFRRRCAMPRATVRRHLAMPWTAVAYRAVARLAGPSNTGEVPGPRHHLARIGMPGTARPAGRYGRR